MDGFRQAIADDESNSLCQKALQKYGCYGNIEPKLLYQSNSAFCEY